MRTLPVALTALCTAAAVAGAPSTAWAKDHNPPGNNGTVKVDGAPFDGGHGNEPHVGCTFHLDFFGFDTGQTATITFTGQAPTKLGTLLTQKGVAISDDAAGGGQDADAVLSYTAGQLGLTNQPAAKQGWHVKVAVDVDNAPGGAKQKVFWLSCPSTAAEKQPETSSPGTPGTAPTGTSGGGSTSTATTSTTRTSTGTATTKTATTGTTTATGSGGGEVTAAAPLAPTYGSGTLSGAGSGTLSGAGGGRLRSQSTSTGLPFTGDETGLLLLVGAGALAAGTALTVVARRRRTAG